MCGFNKMGPLLTLPEPQWLLLEPFSLIASFQQDGATAHTARAAMAVVRVILPDRLISRWPPRSPDLSMCDFFLWGYLKPRAYEGKPRTLEELKAERRLSQGNRDD
jgi:hypothetical protein